MYISYRIKLTGVILLGDTRGKVWGNVKTGYPLFTYMHGFYPQVSFRWFNTITLTQV